MSDVFIDSSVNSAISGCYWSWSDFRIDVNSLKIVFTFSPCLLGDLPWLFQDTRRSLYTDPTISRPVFLGLHTGSLQSALYDSCNLPPVFLTRNGKQGLLLYAMRTNVLGTWLLASRLLAVRFWYTQTMFDPTLPFWKTMHLWHFLSHNWGKVRSLATFT